MEFLDCDLEKQGKSRIAAGKQVLALKYYNEFTRALPRFKSNRGQHCMLIVSSRASHAVVCLSTPPLRLPLRLPQPCDRRAGGTGAAASQPGITADDPVTSSHGCRCRRRGRRLPAS